jgi:hypothetical protein
MEVLNIAHSEDEGETWDPRDEMPLHYGMETLKCWNHMRQKRWSFEYISPDALASLYMEHGLF